MSFMLRRIRSRERQAQKFSRPTLWLLVGCFAMAILVGSGVLLLWFSTAFFWSVDGTVVRSRVMEEKRGSNILYVPAIEYSYEVDGATYRGDRYSYEFFAPGGSVGWAESVCEAYAAGTRCKVLYFPLRPSESVLSRWPRSTELLIWVGLTLVAAASLHGALITLRRKRLAALAIAILVALCAPLHADDSILSEAPVTDADRRHWSFSPLADPSPPAVADETWPIAPIDRFILERLEKAHLRPLPPADRATLLRRVTFDLTGLPPTPEELDGFLADDAADAYDRVVARLLASPAYGEGWAQHWLDLARFAETDGFEHDLVRPEAWRYRDWVIEALNRDLPYDEFVRLQLAADELLPGDAAAAQATGFLLCGPDMPDINSQEERRHTLLNEMTATVGGALLGLQLGCAACHDHKYDPISQADFYRLRACFETADILAKQDAGRVMRERGGEPPVSRLMVRGDFRRPGAELAAAFPRIANPWNDAPPALDPSAPNRGRRTALARWITRPDHPLATRVAVNRLWQAHFGEGLVRTPGDFGLMGDAPSHPELLDWLAGELVRRGWSMKEMHRLLVTSAVYRQASRPSSSEWTAEQTAAAQESWRQSRQADPGNRLLGRMNRRRLEGEAIRDAMLVAGDRLSTRRGGPGAMPPLPDEMLATLLAGQWTVSPDEEDHRRRSVYLFVRRNLRYPLFEVFDGPDRQASCPRRNRSTTAPQALWLLNSEFALAAARDLAGYVLQRVAHDDPVAWVELVYRRALGRAPDDDEVALGSAFLAVQASGLRAAGRTADDLAIPLPLPAGTDPHLAAALVDFCLAAFNTNEFVDVD